MRSERNLGSPRSRAVLLDVEGTTTPPAFVYELLFPYSLTHIEEFLCEHGEDDGIDAELIELWSEHDRDQRAGLPVPPWRTAGKADWIAAASQYARWLIEQDRKSTPLKSLQGRVWRDGYETGELRGQLYPDVPAALERWRQQGRRVAIFSSGSVLAQRLLFRHSVAGDLSELIDAYFDTSVGSKLDPSSYRIIAGELGLPPAQVLFVSDSAAELDTAARVNMRTCLARRSSANTRSTEVSHPSVTSFESLVGQR